jgi:hypothetical protein
MQYSHGVFNHCHPRQLNRHPLPTRLRENRIQAACVSHVSGSTIFVHYGILAPRAAWHSNWLPWFSAY